MTSFSYSPVLYIIEATITLLLGWRLWQSNKLHPSDYSQMLYRLCFLVALAYAIYASSAIFIWLHWPYGFLQGFGMLPVMIGLGFASQFALHLVGLDQPAKHLPKAVTVVAVLYTTAILIYLPKPDIIGGWISWNINPVLVKIQEILVTILAIIPGSILILKPTHGPRSFFKKFFLGMAFILAGSGGNLAITESATLATVRLGHLIELSGFLCGIPILLMRRTMANPDQTSNPPQNR